ncbi:GNAT family N-acetyltransferase [Haemophilus haemolyticus]|uniref:GNAT family N-acetyltransferase n=1 Tax=Haemophilus haemolyticus TaxID=726 RepID=UPI000E5915F8|nr:GNAT family N-acetyltransferase [Haemophilus haemolyticus]
MFQVKKFNELILTELHGIYAARVAVFVVEQNCPYQEVDEQDLHAHHVFLERDGKVAAYCRLIPDDDGVHIGRVLVRSEYRAEKLGRKLVAFALEYATREFAGADVLAQAQLYLEKFYASFGFVTESDDYLEDGIPHIDMRLRANKK